MKLMTLSDLLLEQLQDLYSAEKQLIQALPKMAKAATTPELKDAFKEHLEVTRKQKDRLEKVFGILGHKPKAKKCKGMEGLIEEGKELIEEDAAPEVLDAGLIAAAQRVEHYEMASYGTVRSMAKRLGLDKAVKLLQATLDEEGETDHSLTELAETLVNAAAMKAEE